MVRSQVMHLHGHEHDVLQFFLDGEVYNVHWEADANRYQVAAALQQLVNRLTNNATTSTTCSR